jgi:GT2 family glycosyltransferase
MLPTQRRSPAEDAESLSGHLEGKSGAISCRDAETLGPAAGERLARGDYAGAFALADRRCRLIAPSARDLLLRAEAHRGAGRLAPARRDLDRALALDPTDPALDRAALTWGEPPQRLEAAGRIVARASSVALWRKATAALFESGAGAVHRLRRDGAAVSGWIAWAGDAPLTMEMTRAGATERFSLDPDPNHPLAASGISAAEVAIEAPGGAPLALMLGTAEGARACVEPLLERAPGPRAQKTRPLRPETGEPFVTIIVPVYEDYEATRACLESLAASRPGFAHRILVVDDASPNAALAAYLEEAAAGGAFELIRNETNLGFAASVNKALEFSPRGDALLLNADAVLPPGAVERLRGLSRSSPSVGTVTPFSNNGELTSYPLRNEANPMPTAAEIAELDAQARRVNGDALVDMPNGIGFCLYITQACLDAVGALPEIYRQGYFEDVEFCLIARERGFRNVAAPGVFVGHAGSRSFAERKRALVMRNLELVESRFPGLALETAAFVALDPLKPYRAALDAALVPTGPVTLVVCGSRSASRLGRRRAEALKRDDGTTLLLTRAGRSLNLVAIGDGAPQSLSFETGEAFAEYLGRLDLARAEWLDPASLPEAALAAMIASGAEIDLVCGDLGWFSALAAQPEGACAAPEGSQPCETCRSQTSGRVGEAERQRRAKLGRALGRARAVVSYDRMAESFAARVFKTPAPAPALAAPPVTRRPEGGRIVRLGVLYPNRAATPDRLLLRLARRLAGETAELIVFGGAIEDEALMAAGAFVTGPVAAEEYAELAGHYRVEALLGVDRGAGFGDLEAAAAALGAPKAYFDWSFGALAPTPGDLSLDPRICDDKAVSQIVGWLDGSL